MNSPRIRQLVQPEMSVADRNLSITNEVRTIMTTTALPASTARRTAQQQGVELLFQPDRATLWIGIPDICTEGSTAENG